MTLSYPFSSDTRERILHTYRTGSTPENVLQTIVWGKPKPSVPCSAALLCGRLTRRSSARRGIVKTHNLAGFDFDQLITYRHAANLSIGPARTGLIVVISMGVTTT
jgi:hypothetical protein